MEVYCLTIILLICYVVGELYKQIFYKKQEMYKFIPMIMAVVGAILGVIIYISNPEIIFNVDSIWKAIEIGMISGVSATGSNQIIKQLFKKEELK